MEFSATRRRRCRSQTACETRNKNLENVKSVTKEKLERVALQRRRRRSTGISWKGTRIRNPRTKAVITYVFLLNVLL
jgi:hypothetical protein